MNDKLIHMIAGFIITLAVSALYSPTLGLVCAVIAGIAKELYDRWDYGVFDLDDLASTIVGGGIAFIICIGFSIGA